MTRLSLPCTDLTIGDADRIVAYVREHGVEQAWRLRRQDPNWSHLEMAAFIERNRFMWQGPASDLG